MKKSLFHDLVRFTLHKKNVKTQIKYLILGLLFYRLLAQNFSDADQGNDAASSSQAGDDIYPLF